MNGSFFESGFDMIPLLNQVDADTDVTGDWIKLTNYQRVMFFVAKYGSEDVDTLGFQIVQATDATGTGVKGVNVSRYWTKQGTLTSQGLWTAGTLTTPDDIIGIGSAAPTGGTLIVGTDVDTNPAIVAVDLLATDLDVNNGFDWVTLRIEGDEVNNAALVSAWAILMGARFGQLVPTNVIA